MTTLCEPRVATVMVDQPVVHIMEVKRPVRITDAVERAPFDELPEYLNECIVDVRWLTVHQCKFHAITIVRAPHA